MGRGDKKSRQGKIWRGSYGKRRPKPGSRKNRARPANAKARQAGAKETTEAVAPAR